MRTLNTKAALAASLPVVLLLLTLAFSPAHAGQLGPLSSWNDGPAKAQVNHGLHLGTGTPVTTVEDVDITLENVLQVKLKDKGVHQARGQAGVTPVAELGTLQPTAKVARSPAHTLGKLREDPTSLAQKFKSVW